MFELSEGSHLRRVTYEIANGHVYVATERAIRMAETGELPAVGFPLDDAFVFDAVELQRLEATWERDATTQDADWSRLRPLADALGVS